MDTIKKYLTGKDVCSLLNKDCAGPVGYYVLKDKTNSVGMVIHTQVPNVSVGGGSFSEALGDIPEVSGQKYPPEVYKILPEIKYTFVGSDLTIKIKENLPIEETMIGKTYSISKIPYARSFLYLIKDFDKQYLNDLLLGLAFSIYIERQRTPEGELEAGSEEGGSSFNSFGGGF